jgi:hypothetical protein
VNLNVDLDVVLCVPAQALLAAFRLRLPGNYAHAAPDTLQRRFLDTPGEIITTSDGITVKINRRAYSPILRHATPRRHHRPVVGRTPPGSCGRAVKILECVATARGAGAEGDLGAPGAHADRAPPCRTGPPAGG